MSLIRAAFVLAPLVLPSTAIASDLPNIILIYTDDQGYGDASCLNVDAKFQNAKH